MRYCGKTAMLKLKHEKQKYKQHNQFTVYGKFELCALLLISQGFPSNQKIR